MSQTIELFPQGAHDPIEQKIDRALGAILRLFQAVHPVVIAYSGGKDSSVVAALVLHAALLHRAAAGKPLVIVTTSDTKESPEVMTHYHEELQHMREFGRVHGFGVITGIARPSLGSTFQVKILSGRALPSFPGTHGDCSDLKIAPQRAFRERLFRSLAERGAAARSRVSVPVSMKVPAAIATCVNAESPPNNQPTTRTVSLSLALSPIGTPTMSGRPSRFTVEGVARALLGLRGDQAAVCAFGRHLVCGGSGCDPGGHVGAKAGSAAPALVAMFARWLKTRA